MSRGRWIVGGFIVLGVLSACEASWYRAEVGYDVDGREHWHIGEPKSREDCTSEAIGMFNRLNAKADDDEIKGHRYPWENRAFSWACLEVDIRRPYRSDGTLNVLARVR